MGQHPVAAPIYPRSQDTKRSIESTARNRRKDSVVQYISLCLGTLQPVGAIRRIIANRRSLRPLLYQNARFALSCGKRKTDRCRKFHVARHRTSNVVESGCHLIISFRKRRIRTYRENGIAHYRMRRYLETSPLGRAEWIKFFGLLYGKEVEADSIFTEVEKTIPN